MTLFNHAKGLLRSTESINNLQFVDLSDKIWLHPLEVLPLAVLVQEKKLLYSPPQDISCKGYLDYLRFPEGLTRYSILRQSYNYIPIYSFGTVPKTILDLRLKSSLVTDLIKLFERRIGVYRGINNALFLSITEIIDNIEEHANSKRGWIHAQWYPEKGYLDICIVDTGITIRGSYDKHDISVLTDAQAIKKALEGVSVKPERGTGIRTLINICTRGFGGEVILLSGNGLAYATKKGSYPYKTRNRWEGTIVGLRIPRQSQRIDYTDYIAQ